VKWLVGAVVALIALSALGGDIGGVSDRVSGAVSNGVSEAAETGAETAVESGIGAVGGVITGGATGAASGIGETTGGLLTLPPRVAGSYLGGLVDGITDGWVPTRLGEGDDAVGLIEPVSVIGPRSGGDSW
jgi:hypothetical protein